MEEKVLVTGGAGYIGTHRVVQLLKAVFSVSIFDNLYNGCRTVLDRTVKLTGTPPEFIEGDIQDPAALRNTFKNHSISAFIKFVGPKAVGESEAQPLKFYDNNVFGSVFLLEEKARAGIKNLVFSSSAAGYGDSEYAQYLEDMRLAPVNFYGRTKLMLEDTLRDIKNAQPSWHIALLRYFSPVGSDASGMIGKDPSGAPNNLMPFIDKVAVGKRVKLSVFGGDYLTSDRIGRRDRIHVEDLVALTHLSHKTVILQRPVETT